MRVDAVSPGAVEETVAKIGGLFPPLIPTVSLDHVLTGYARSVFGPSQARCSSSSEHGAHRQECLGSTAT